MTNKIYFLPGASGSTEFWQPVINCLPDTYMPQVIAYPGFGGEEANEKVQNFEQLQDYVLNEIQEKSVLVAQSMGGIFAMTCALQHPERVQALVLTATSGGVDLSPFQVADWRDAYQQEYLDYPNWFLNTNLHYDAKLKHIKIPVLLIWGDHDPISPVAVGEYLARQLPHATLKIIKNGDHHLAYQHAEAVASLILEHLSE